MKTKAQLRKEIMMLRESISFEEVNSRSKKIYEKLKKDKDYIKAKTVMFYISKDKEVATHDMVKEALKSKKVIVPKVHNKGLLCCSISNFENMKFSCFGILEPVNEITCDTSEIDLIIVPGTVFDKKFHRIGYGGGYYDKLLKNFKGKKIGLAYGFQIVDRIPNDEWDVKLDKVITD